MKPPAATTPFSATSNVLLMVPPMMSISTPVITQSTPINRQPSRSSNAQPLTAATDLSVSTDISENPETHVSEHFKLNCKITAIPDADGDEEWDLLDDFKPLIPQLAEKALEMETDDEIPDVEEWEVLHDVKPVIPVPLEIALRRGKNETVLFEHPANQYKFVDQELKKQNLCIVNILHNYSNGRVRLLMRREEMPEVCANHYITPDMEIHPLLSLDQAWTWVAQELVNEELKPEHFFLRFQDVALAAAFQTAFMEAVDIAKDSLEDDFSSSNVSETDSHVITRPFDLNFASRAASWHCKFCKATNGPEKHFCYICKSTNPIWSEDFDVCPDVPMVSEIKITENSKTNNFDIPKVPTTDSHIISKLYVTNFSKPKFWCCPLCETTNGVDKYYCVSCETSKPGLW